MSAHICDICGRDFGRADRLKRHIDSGCGRKREAEVDTSRVWNTPFPGEWINRGVCRSIDTDLFFPESGKDQQAARAKAVCATCPVLAQCREYAMTNRAIHGIWGGTSRTERLKAARQGAAA